MKNEKISVSCIVLTYNHEKYIYNCLMSLLSCNFQPMHIWVLDDGSTDNTPLIVTELAQSNGRITLLTQPNSGGLTAANSQRLLDESHGEYVLFMSGDDLLGPSFPLAKTVQMLNANPHLALVLPRLLFLTEDPSQPVPSLYTPGFLATLRSHDSERVLQGHLYCSVSRIFLQGMVIRRSIIEDIDGFDTTLKADDYAFIIRLFKYLAATHHSFHFDENSLWLYRLHPDNIHRAAIRQFQLIAEVVAKYIPQKYWKNFRWDSIIFETFSDIQKARNTAKQLFGSTYGKKLLWRTECATLRYARRRGNTRLIRQALSNPQTSLIPRVYAACSIFPALLNRF